MIQGEKSPLTNLTLNFFICKTESKVHLPGWDGKCTHSKHMLITITCFIIHEKTGIAETMVYGHQILLYFVFLFGHTGRPLFPSFLHEYVSIMWLSSELWEKVMQSICGLAHITIPHDPLLNFKAWDQVFKLATRWTLSSFSLLKCLIRVT